MILSIINNQESCGKTTLAFILSGLFLKNSLKVLLVDLSPFGDLTNIFLSEKSINPKQSFVEYLLDIDNKPFTVSNFIIKTKFPGLDILPSSPELSLLDNYGWSMDKFGTKLANFFNKNGNVWDIIIVDTFFTKLLACNSFYAADKVIIPCIGTATSDNCIIDLLKLESLVQHKKLNEHHTLFVSDRNQVSLHKIMTVSYSSVLAGCIRDNIFPHQLSDFNISEYDRILGWIHKTVRHDSRFLFNNH